MANSKILPVLLLVMGAIAAGACSPRSSSFDFDSNTALQSALLSGRQEISSPESDST